jgi:hypothetical protein
VSPNDWAMLIATGLGILATLVAGFRWIFKSLMYEFRPNGGNSLRDQVNRLEEKVDTLYQILLQRGDK